MLLLRIIAGLFCVVALAMMTAGLVQVRGQHLDNTASAVTTGTVEATSLEEVRINTKRGTQTRYRPVIRYVYTVEGREFRGERLRPYDDDFDHTTARQIRDAFRPGASLPVFYRPDDPQRSFLQRHTSFDPYGLTLMGPFFLVAGLLTASLDPTPRTPTPIPSGSGYVLPPRQRLRRRRGVLLIASAIWIVPLLGIAHYFANARPIETVAWVFAGIYAVVAVVLFGWAARLVLLSRDATDATVRIASPTLGRDRVETVDVELPLRDGLAHGPITVSLVCWETTSQRHGGRGGRHHREIGRHTQTLREAGTTPLAPIRGQVRFTLPPETRPTTPAGDSTYPRIAWEVRVEADLTGRPNYVGRFPVPVS